jgi:DNA-binding response OmpR family regulator
VGYAITTSAAGPGHQPLPQPQPAGNRAAPDPGLLVDHAQRRVWADGHEVRLTLQEFELLAFLAAHPATVFTRAELVERVWHRTLAQNGRPVARDSRTVDVHVSRVRRKLGPRHGQCLVTEYRVGYQYRPRSA